MNHNMRIRWRCSLSALEGVFFAIWILWPLTLKNQDKYISNNPSNIGKNKLKVHVRLPLIRSHFLSNLNCTVRWRAGRCYSLFIGCNRVLCCAVLGHPVSHTPDGDSLCWCRSSCRACLCVLGHIWLLSVTLCGNSCWQLRCLQSEKV